MYKLKIDIKNIYYIFLYIINIYGKKIIKIKKRRFR